MYCDLSPLVVSEPTGLRNRTRMGRLTYKIHIREMQKKTPITVKRVEYEYIQDTHTEDLDASLVGLVDRRIVTALAVVAEILRRHLLKSVSDKVPHRILEADSAARDIAIA